MCSKFWLAALFGVALICPIVSSGQDVRPPAAKLGKPTQPEAYYASNDGLDRKVRLSDDMAAKLIEIIGRKPKPYVRTLRVAPRGFFIVKGKAYAYFGFIATDQSMGDSWDDPALERFWEELNRVKDDLGPLKDFKP